MTRLLTAALLLASAAIGAWIWSALAQPAMLAGAAPAGRPLPAAHIAAVGDPSQRRVEQVALILARPLFSPDRRPKSDAAPAAAASITSLPRMTAILINGTRRSAIFDGKGKPTVLGEGGRLGPFTIQTIEPQQVIVLGPEGKRAVRTSFSSAPPPAPALPQGLPMPIGPVILPPGMPSPPGPPNPGPAR